MTGFGDLANWRFGDCEEAVQSPNHPITQSQNGFTLLEMLVATVIMGIAVVGLLSNLSTSLGNAARLADYDRAALIARRTMGGLLLEPRLPAGGILEGRLVPQTTGVDGGWRARLSVFEQSPKPVPGEGRLERIELEVWWMTSGRRRSLSLEGFRRGINPLPQAAVDGGQP